MLYFVKAIELKRLSMGLFFIASCIAQNLCAQIGKQFPALEVERIDGSEALLPLFGDNDFALIGLASSAKAEEELRTWQEPVYNAFIAKTGLMDQLWDVEIGFVPMFTGASKASKGQVLKKLRENNEKLVLDHVYIYSGDAQPLDALGIDDRKKPYFYLLNAEGVILWYRSGQFRQKYLEEIMGLMAE